MIDCSKEFIQTIQDKILKLNLNQYCNGPGKSYNLEFAKILKTSSESNITTLLFIFLVLFLLFLSIEIISKNYMSIYITYITEKLLIPKTIAAMSLVTFSNGAPDIIDALESSKNNGQGLGIALGCLLGAFVFCSSIVVAYVVKNSRKERLNVPVFQIKKEIFMYCFGILIIFVWDLKGNFLSWYSFFLPFVYVVYFGFSIYYEKKHIELNRKRSFRIGLLKNDKLGFIKKKEFKDEELQILLRKESSIVVSTFPKKKMSIKEFFESYLFGHSDIIIDYISIPFKLVYIITIPNLVFSLDQKEIPFIIWFYNETFTIGISSFLLIKNFSNISVEYILLFSLIITVLSIISVIKISLKSYHRWLMVIFGLGGSLAWIKITAKLILSCIYEISFEYSIDPTFLATVLISAGNTIPDLFNNGYLSALGESTVGIMACFSGQLFNFLIGFFLTVYFGNKNFFDIFGFHSKILSREHLFLRFLTLSALCFLALNFLILYFNEYCYEKKHCKILIMSYLVFLVISIIINFG